MTLLLLNFKLRSTFSTRVRIIVKKNLNDRRSYHRRPKIIRKIIRKIMRRLPSTNYKGPRFELYTRILAWLGSDCKIIPLCDFEAASQPIIKIAESCEYFSETPSSMGQTPSRHCGEMPAIMGRLFLNACVNSNSSAIVTQEKIAIPRLYIEHPSATITDSNFLLSQAHGKGVVLRSDLQSVKSGIAVFGSGSSNWYHWLIEILPAAFLSERLSKDYDDFELMIPEHCIASGTFRDTIDLFASTRSRILMPFGINFNVEKLIGIDPVVVGPMNMQPSQWPEVADYSHNAEILLAYRAAIIDRLNLTPSRPSRHIFLARNKDRRSFNQSELIEISQRYGFEVVYPERMNFREQVQMYLDSSFIVGASGAAFANILFCQPDTRSLTWLLPQYSGFCAYSNLANVVGVKLNYLFVEPLSPINSTFDAYSASYILSPSDFETALKKMT